MSTSAEIVLVVEGAVLASLEPIFPTLIELGMGRPGVIEFIYPRVTKAKLEIFANEHPPPHFRITYKGQSANYSLASGTRLAKNEQTRLKDREVLAWWKEHRLDLAKLWNETRPFNCPVGKIQVPPEWQSATS